MARARLRDRHQENLKKKLQVLIAEQGVEREEESSQASIEAEPIKEDEDEPSTSAANAEQDERNEEDSQSE